MIHWDIFSQYHCLLAFMWNWWTFVFSQVSINPWNILRNLLMQVKRWLSWRRVKRFNMNLKEQYWALHKREGGSRMYWLKGFCQLFTEFSDLVLSQPIQAPDTDCYRPLHNDISKTSNDLWSTQCLQCLMDWNLFLIHYWHAMLCCIQVYINELTVRASYTQLRHFKKPNVFCLL